MTNQPVLRIAVSTLLAAGLLVSPVAARADGDLAKQSQNPVSSLISVPFENNLTFNNGPEGAVVDVLNIKPVIPTGLSKNWNLINRFIIPAVYQGERIEGEGKVFGLGDITYQSFVSPKAPGKFVWGVGPSLVMPTGMDRLGSDQWSLGVNVIGLTMPGRWVVGALVSNIWSIAGYGDAPDVNLLIAQYFINYNLDGGWYLTTSPAITANWEADSDNTWTVPFGGGAGRVFKIGNQPVSAQLAAYYTVEKPDHVSDWNIQAMIKFLFPK